MSFVRERERESERERERWVLSEKDILDTPQREREREIDTTLVR